MGEIGDAIGENAPGAAGSASVRVRSCNYYSWGLVEFGLVDVIAVVVDAAVAVVVQQLHARQLQPFVEHLAVVYSVGHLHG